MARILFGVIAAVASLMLVDALVCNKCNYGLADFCISNTNETCSTNTSQCFSAKATFPSISSTVGFNSLGCRESTTCSDTTNGTVLGITYQTAITCCDTDNCNTVAMSGAPSTQVTLSAAVGAAVLASVWGSFL